MQIGQVLTATTGSWAGNPTGYAYQIQRSSSGGVAPWGLMSSTNTHTIGPGEIGYRYRVIVTASRPGSSVAATSAETAQIQTPPAPVNTALPALNGLAKIGQVLTATTGTWSGSPTSYTYQIQRSSAGGVAPWGLMSNTNTHTIGPGESGYRYRVIVTATSSGGSSASATSAETAQIVP
jgi:hypothetical protein